VEGDAELIERGFEAFRSGDLSGLRELLHPRVTWRTPPGAPFGPLFQGIDEVLGYLSEIIVGTEGTYRAELLEVRDRGTRSDALIHSTAVRQGRRLDLEEMLIIRTDGSQIVEIEEVEGSGEWTAFWSA
jgi:uncharacterized protein